MYTCDGEKSAGAGKLFGRYTEALLLETERRLAAISAENSAPINVPTVYIGGGTPSLLGETGITQLLGGIKDLITGSVVKEITVEANPETATPGFLRACADHGVSRLSLGIQSFDQAVLKNAGRHTALDKLSVSKVLSEASAVFGQGLSLDLISGFPGHNKAILAGDLEKALSYSPGHISLYSLTLEEGTPLARYREKKGRGNFLSDEEAEILWLSGRDFLKNAGFDHYEISNFALGKERRSMHNTRYWRMENWLGVGPGASSTFINDNGCGRRTLYSPDTAIFDNGARGRAPHVFITEELGLSTVLKETLMMGYRYCGGPDTEVFQKRFGKTIEETIPQTLKKWAGKAGDKPLHELIMCFLNPFLLDAFKELDNHGVLQNNSGGINGTEQ